MSYDACTPADNSYGYVPSLAPGIVYTLVFGAMTVFGVVGTVRRKLWFLSFTLGAALETLGWIARSAAHGDPCDRDLFIMQIVCLLLAPAFFSAALYLLLGVLIRQRPAASPLRPDAYLVVFCGADFVSLLVQAVGGGFAGGADDEPTLELGTHIMLAGVFLQLVAMTAFGALACLFLLRARRAGHATDARLVGPLVACTLLVQERNVFRAVELLGGWRGRLNTTEAYLCTLDAAAMALCLALLCTLVPLDARDPALLERRETASTAEDETVVEKDVTRRSSEASSQV